MAGPAFEQLEVYKLAEELADEIWRLVLTWSPFARETLGKQAVEASDTIGANLTEGYGRGSARDNHRFVRIARGSLNETIHWMRTACRRKLLKPGQVSRIKSLLDELAPRLNAYLRSIAPFRWAGRRKDSDEPKTAATGPQTTNNEQRTTNNGH
jgi:four helix bundle protein